MFPRPAVAAYQGSNVATTLTVAPLTLTPVEHHCGASFQAHLGQPWLYDLGDSRMVCQCCKKDVPCATACIHGWGSDRLSQGLAWLVYTGWRYGLVQLGLSCSPLLKGEGSHVWFDVIAQPEAQGVVW